MKTPNPLTTATSNPGWWHQPAMAPLQALKIAAGCLECGEVVPAPAATILARALRRFLAGESDLTANLGLRPPRGGRNQTPVARELNDTRNDHIKALFDAQSGGKCERAKKVADLLSAGPTNEITEAHVMTHLLWLNENFGDGNLPASFQRILGIVNTQ